MKERQLAPNPWRADLGRRQANVHRQGGKREQTHDANHSPEPNFNIAQDGDHGQHAYNKGHPG